MMNEQIKEQDNLWLQCPEGAIQQVADASMLTRAATPATNLQRRRLLATAATAAGIAVLGGVSYLAIREPAMDNSPVPGTGGGGPIATFNYGGINCIEVVRSIPDYVQNTIEDAEKTEQIKQHLVLCEKCRKVHESSMES